MTNSKAAEELTAIISVFRTKHAAGIAEMANDADRLRNACQQIERTWSGSFAGWHGRMYFRDFQIPSIRERFSGEWGGIHGIPAGWEEKQPEVVQAKIESLAGNNLSTDKFEKDLEAFQKEFEKLKAEIIGHFDELDHGSLTQRGKGFVNAIEQFSAGKTKYEFVQEGLPGTMMSRDTEALRQGTCIASWLYYEGVACAAKSACEATSNLLDLGERLVKMLEKKPVESPTLNTPGSLGDIHSEIYEKCHDLYEKKAYAEAVEKSFKVVRDRLRKLTGYETGSEAFGKGKLHIKGAIATHVDQDFNDAVKFLAMAIDRFRNEKSHSSDGKIDNPVRAYEYLRLSSLAMNLLDSAEILP
jgi:uncharacterized protein (TIGR02391 family)